MWGFRIDKLGTNRRKWELLERGMPVLLYFEHGGVRGVWAFCEVVDKWESSEPVDYWVRGPRSYPLQIRLRFVLPRLHEPSRSSPFRLEWFDGFRPVRREELASAFGVRALKAFADRWSLFIFGDQRGGVVTYSYSSFEAILNELRARNIVRRPSPTPSHDEVRDLIYEIGLIQGKNPVKEYPLENKFVDVVWRRTPKSVPYMVFEVSLAGNLYADLVKLKHAYDVWNSIPVLVTTRERMEEAMKWISGTFHEVESVFRVITVERLREFYEEKKRVKELENELGLV